jgi:hypothetical protein
MSKTEFHTGRLYPAWYQYLQEQEEKQEEDI